MKRILSCLLIAALFLSAAAVAIAEAPAAGSLKVEKQTIRGNSSWTPESYPEIWITPIFVDFIIEGRDSERYPANFLCFAPPEGTSPLSIEYNSASVVDFDTLFQYSYSARDRYDFESFLEAKDVEAENILADGSADGIAMYVIPDNRRGRALIDLQEYFGGDAKLWIQIYDHTGDLSGDELAGLIRDEAARVRSAMRLAKLDRYWSQGVFAGVALYDDYQKVDVAVDTTGMTVVRLEDRKLEIKELVDGKVCNTVISLGDLMYADQVEDRELADGTPYKRHTMESSSYAFFLLQGKNRDVYLSVKIETPAEDFTAKLEKIFPLITLPAAE